MVVVNSSLNRRENAILFQQHIELISRIMDINYISMDRFKPHGKANEREQFVANLHSGGFAYPV